jgi:hypothetical protein
MRVEAVMPADDWEAASPARVHAQDRPALSEGHDHGCLFQPRAYDAPRETTGDRTGTCVGVTGLLSGNHEVALEAE